MAVVQHVESANFRIDSIVEEIDVYYTQVRLHVRNFKL